MTGETIVIATAFFGDVMNEAERSEVQFAGVNGNAGLRIPVIVENVMIAFDKPDGQVGKILSPSPEKRQLQVLAAVKKIANDQQLLRLKILDLRQQPVKVFFVNGSRHSNP